MTIAVTGALAMSVAVATTVAVAVAMTMTVAMRYLSIVGKEVSVLQSWCITATVGLALQGKLPGST